MPWNGSSLRHGLIGHTACTIKGLPFDVGPSRHGEDDLGAMSFHGEDVLLEVGLNDSQLDDLLLCLELQHTDVGQTQRYAARPGVA